MLVSVVSSLFIASSAFIPVGAFPCYDCGNSSPAVHNDALSASIGAAAAPQSRPQENSISNAISGGPAKRKKRCAKPPTASKPPAEPSLPTQPPQEPLPKIPKQDSSSKPRPKTCKPRPPKPQPPVKACKPKPKTPVESSDQPSTPPYGINADKPAETQPQPPQVDEQPTGSQEQLLATPSPVKPEEPAQEPENAAKGSDKPTYGSELPKETQMPLPEPQGPTYGTEQPAGNPQTPTETTQAPPQAPQTPPEEPQKPTYGPKQPAGEPQTPSEANQVPQEAPQKPAQEPQKPAQEPQKPTEEPKQPSNPGFSKGRPGGNMMATAHVQFASSIGVLGCKGVDLSRIAFFPGTPGCDDFCVKVTYGKRSVNLLRIDSSGSAPSPDNSGTHDMSCQAYDYLVHGTDNKSSCKTGDRTPMSYETVDPRECKHLLKDGVLPISAPSPNYFVQCANSPTFKDGGLKLALFNINDSRCEHGIDEECSWSGVGDPKCPSGLGTGSQRSPGLQISDPSYGG
ncbi:hypothetical protein CDD80_4541 [Ophiocordyceps camponoti-rufipedis]|uniref:Uncharacterized protein n=1 Tax=Ophiocordyceps camponoti-rufipedis TaxID=2004952 RepID=A0A2C5Y2V3_9HYPO|nr:hypothetical protein CDD80_4541 [Ophiocordyceps camponoti-rufipedis]